MHMEAKWHNLCTDFPHACWPCQVSKWSGRILPSIADSIITWLAVLPTIKLGFQPYVQDGPQSCRGPLAWIATMPSVRRSLWFPRFRITLRRGSLADWSTALIAISRCTDKNATVKEKNHRNRTGEEASGELSLWLVLRRVSHLQKMEGL